MLGGPQVGAARDAARCATGLLLLFDIDGTLLRGGNLAHGEALIAALARVHGIDASHLYLRVSPAGRTDGEIARVILL
ncbi:MAG: hypothetical protein ACLP0J_14150, partial [Solirubrobacteraceae bacterium]